MFGGWPFGGEEGDLLPGPCDSQRCEARCTARNASAIEEEELGFLSGIESLRYSGFDWKVAIQRARLLLEYIYRLAVTVSARL